MQLDAIYDGVDNHVGTLLVDGVQITYVRDASNRIVPRTASGTPRPPAITRAFFGVE